MGKIMFYLIGCKSIPQNGVVPDGHVCSYIYSSVESSGAVDLDCNVRVKIQRNVQMVKFSVKKKTLVQDHLWFVLQRGGHIQHLCSVLK